MDEIEFQLGFDWSTHRRVDAQAPSASASAHVVAPPRSKALNSVAEDDDGVYGNGNNHANYITGGDVDAASTRGTGTPPDEVSVDSIGNHHHQNHSQPTQPPPPESLASLPRVPVRRKVSEKAKRQLEEQLALQEITIDQVAARERYAHPPSPTTAKTGPDPYAHFMQPPTPWTSWGSPIQGTEEFSLRAAINAAAVRIGLGFGLGFGGVSSSHGAS